MARDKQRGKQPDKPSDKPEDPRVLRTRADVARAAAELLIDQGWDRVTHANVAAASGYSRATLYKHWPQITDLLRAGFLHIGGLPHGEVTGDLRQDLISEMEAFRRVLIDDRLAVSLVALADRSTASADIAKLRDQFMGDGQSLLRELISKGIRARALRDGIKVGPAADMLSGALVLRVAVMGKRVGRGYIEAIVDIFLHGTAK
ncbi:MAG: TetR/AcrR family transcriptional regulator [Myxococcota bacterium]